MNPVTDRRSIQDIIPPARSKIARPSITPPQGVVAPPPLPTPRPPEEQFSMQESEPRRSLMPFILIAGGAVLVALIVIGLMSTIFHTASASVTIAEYRSDVSGTYTADTTGEGADALTYEPLSVEERVTKTVAASGSAQVEDRAMGTITISNMGTQQRLITNTRFESKGGLVYRIHAPIVVPAAATKGGVKTAGVIDAVVYADQPGDKYNSGATTFTVPGLKGSPQFDLITASSKGAISGGFVGTRATVEKSIREAAVTELRAEADRALRAKVAGAFPEGTIVFPDSIAITYREEPDKAEGGNATIAVVGTALAPAFNADALARALAVHAQIAATAPLKLENAGELSFAAGPGGNVQAGGAISFTLGGSAHLVSKFDPVKLATDLAGRTQAEAEQVRAEYASLVGPIALTVQPFWMSTLPADPEKIEVTVLGALDQNP